MLPPHTPKPSLEQLLRRKDIWRGHSQTFVNAASVDSGYPTLNQALLHRGWPLGCVIEVCQSYHASEWCLFHPAIGSLIKQHNDTSPVKNGPYLVLLNPPALPFIGGLKQMGLPDKRIVVVQTLNKQEFVSAFIELCRSSACAVLMSWQPKQQLHYTQLRKMQLACAEQAGLYILFRHSYAQQQSSPASLRLMAQPLQDSLQLHIFKQKGKLQRADVALAIPSSWEYLPSHKQLQRAQDDTSTARRTASSKGQVLVFPKVLANLNSTKA